MAEVGLRLHPTKTRIVNCKDGQRRSSMSTPNSRSWGSRFRARRNGGKFTGFLPAICKDALNTLSRQLREWRLHVHTGHALAELARQTRGLGRRCLFPSSDTFRECGVTLS